MRFSEVVGQRLVKEKLIRSVQQNRVSHAQLFLGPEGNGDLALALAFAQYLNCENKTAHDSCGVCPSCLKSQKLIHPDIHFSFPVYKKKAGADHPALSRDFINEWREALLDNPYCNLFDWLDFIRAENKQGNLSADECRAIISLLNMTTFESKYKVMIVWQAGQLGKEGNILLKLLEEPPPNTLIILTAENRDQLLTTILSRCQIMSVPRLADDEMLEALQNQHGLQRDAAMKIMRHADGNYREALRIIGHVEDDLSALLIRWMQLLFKNDHGSMVNWVEAMSRAGREKQKSFFRYALEFFRESMLLQQAGEAMTNLMDEEKKLAQWLAGRMAPGDWSQVRLRFEQAHYAIERNAAPKILFMNLSFALRDLIAEKKLHLAD